MHGLAVNCTKCKLLISQIFLNAEKQRFCADCFQLEYNNTYDNLQRAFGQLYSVLEKTKKLEQRVKVYEANIKSFTRSFK